MKKIIALALSLILVLSLSVTAFAADVTIDNDTPDLKEGTTAKGTFQATAPAEDTFSVAVSWNNLAFTYKDAVAGSWDPETHTYLDSAVAGWLTNNDAKIVVENHSNVKINVLVENTDVGGDNGLGVTLTNAAGTLEAGSVAEEQLVTPSLEVGVAPKGTLTAGQTDVKLADITVTISKWTPGN